MSGYGSGKTINSGPNDHIFVYYTDHGGPGILAFPHPELNFLSATDLIQTITYMHLSKKYKEMVLYIDACYSGSMFDGLLPNDVNVYATTAANATQEASKFNYDMKLNAFLSTEYREKCLWP